MNDSVVVSNASQHHNKCRPCKYWCPLYGFSTTLQTQHTSCQLHKQLRDTHRKQTKQNYGKYSIPQFLMNGDTKSVQFSTYIPSVNTGCPRNMRACMQSRAYSIGQLVEF